MGVIGHRTSSKDVTPRGVDRSIGSGLCEVITTLHILLATHLDFLPVADATVFIE